MKDVYKCVKIILQIVQLDQEENSGHATEREDLTNIEYNLLIHILFKSNSNGTKHVFSFCYI